MNVIKFIVEAKSVPLAHVSTHLDKWNVANTYMSYPGLLYKIVYLPPFIGFSSETQFSHSVLSYKRKIEHIFFTIFQISGSRPQMRKTNPRGSLFCLSAYLLTCPNRLTAKKYLRTG